ncbi:ATP-binding protein [Tanticharoenia sakaeratensis]|uniref:histidine kinase n=1 Tax=Tanticharoenia sakaeratensis NBRC 103193 TaxID=1231623 RepID=A0A0D6MNR6_9PROT|nr:ATP-binding protein [Tanticharoenia sakaeratensis]GAN55091.1 osmolarity sensor protein envZ [Tanticharoenia sakaeratensis NBRC 103193]GBQ20190.1 two component sensor histidine kinase EnvZ [Tanticharoenia sakaeratensis NBRC 103193]
MTVERGKWGRGLERPIRRVLPRSLLGRSLLIVLIPLLVTQAIALELFYGNYLSVVSRRMSESVVGEIAFTLDMLDSDPGRSEWILARARARTQLAISLRRGAHLAHAGSNHVLGPWDDDLARTLRLSLDRPFLVDWQRDLRSVQISVQLREGVLDVTAPRKRLHVGPIWLFVVWAVGSSLVLFVIASLFMRNQVRAVGRLTRAAESFGLGRDPGPIRPEGAQEIRKAATAFNRMQERVNRFVAQRTAVLAGVSHDLRTPLTRLRLTVAMLPQEGQVDASVLRQDASDMVSDIEEMERLIGSYLSFARGEGDETPVPTDLVALIEDVASAATRAGGTVVGRAPRVIAPGKGRNVEITVRPDALRRVLGNLADNARRHGGRMSFEVRDRGRQVQIAVDDDGPGIPKARRERVFRAYDSSGPAGGNGLGLTIARDIVHAHGGAIRLMESPMGGLRVLLTLPR